MLCLWLQNGHGCTKCYNIIAEYDASKRRLLALPKLPGVDKSDMIDEEQRLIQLSSVIPLECVNLVSSVGALVKYVEKQRLGTELEDRATRIPILAVKNFSL